MPTLVSTRRTHVLIILGNAIVGGMEMSVKRLIARLPRDAHAVSCLCPCEGALADDLRGHGCDVHIVPIDGEPSWRTVHYGALLVRTAGVDVIHAHLANAHVLGGLIGHLAGVPVLAHVHGRGVDMADVEVHRLVDSHVCVVSRSAYYQALGAGIRRDRLHCVSNGVDLDEFAPRDRHDAVRAAVGLSARDTVIGFVGRLSPEKGPDVFLRAAAIASNTLPALRFVMLGEGPMRSDLDTLARRLGVAHSVRFAGLQDDLANWYPSLDVVVSTSWTEGLPLALMEAMACERPVIATRVGGVAELIAHGVTGLLCPAGDASPIAQAMVRLATSAEQRRALGHAARRHVAKHHDVRRVVDDIARLYATVAHAHVDPRVDRRFNPLSTVNGAAHGRSSADALGQPSR